LRGDPIQPHLSRERTTPRGVGARSHPARGYRVGSRRVALVRALLLVAALALVPGSARAGVSQVRGTIAFGYSKLFATHAPGGNLCTSAGLSYPIRPTLSIGPSMAFHLLGSRTVNRGSNVASVDYSAFEAALLAHWKPTGWGPVALVSAGPALVNARAELSTTSGGAGFRDLALQHAVAGAALDVTLMKSREAPVRVGFQMSSRWAFLPDEDWLLVSGRLCFHY
jgi:hypothetical protein